MSFGSTSRASYWTLIMVERRKGGKKDENTQQTYTIIL